MSARRNICCLLRLLQQVGAFVTDQWRKVGSRRVGREEGQGNQSPLLTALPKQLIRQDTAVLLLKVPSYNGVYLLIGEGLGTVGKCGACFAATGVCEALVVCAGACVCACVCE